MEIDPRIPRSECQIARIDRYDESRLTRIVAEVALSCDAPSPLDLAVFAVPDPLTLATAFANLWLESSLFTSEAFAAA